MSATTTYRATPLKQKRRTNAQIAQLDQQIIDVLEEDNPQSVRHVFYRMTDPRLPEPVEKSDAGYRHVQARCVQLRRCGAIPYDYFVDMSRQGYFVNVFYGASDFISQLANQYRADPWDTTDCVCEVWCESRSIAGVLQGLCTELAVSLYPCGGFSSLSFIYEAAEKHNNYGDDKPLVIFYVGDYDPAGVLIDVSLENELRLHLNTDDLTFIRLGINKDQIIEYNLPTKPRKASDVRSLHVAYSVEAEAMPAGILRQIVRDAIIDLLPDGALEDASLETLTQQSVLREIAGNLQA